MAATAVTAVILHTPWDGVQQGGHAMNEQGGTVRGICSQIDSLSNAPKRDWRTCQRVSDGWSSSACAVQLQSPQLPL